MIAIQADPHGRLRRILALLHTANDLLLAMPSSFDLLQEALQAIAAKLIRFAFKKSTKKNCFKDEGFWERIKPSSLRANGEAPPVWMTFDDAWVDEVRRGVIACKVFLWYPLYWLAYNQVSCCCTSCR
jgi:hypothetical protein